MVVTLGHVGTAILCEDVRREVGNKRTLVGILAGDILVPSFPSLLNFAVYVEYIPLQTGRLDFSLEAFIGDVKAFIATGQMLVSQPKNPAIIDIPKLSANIIEPVEIRVNASFAGGPMETIISKQVILGEAEAFTFANVPWPPFSQSPPAAP
jgi:hypothetical protein